MSDERFRELLRSLPREQEIQQRAARARSRALDRFVASGQSAPAWQWAPAVVLCAVLLVLVGVAIGHVSAGRSPQLAASQDTVLPEARNLRMKWVLSDGTRVLWTFREDLKL